MRRYNRRYQSKKGYFVDFLQETGRIFKNRDYGHTLANNERI